MPLPLLPPTPSRDDPTTFAAKAEAFLAALSDWGDAANALEQSLQLVATTGTSTTSLAIATGAKALTTQPGKAWVAGAYVYLVSSASLANRMVGQVTAYDSTTGALSVTVSSTAGSGTFTAWIIGLATSNATAAEVSVADAAGKFVASTVETVLAEIFDAVRNNSWLSADAGGTANAITASFSPTITALTHRQVVYVRASAANTGSATFQVDATTAKSIYKGSNKDLLPGDIAGAGHLLVLRRDQTLDKWELLNPARGVRDSICPLSFSNLSLSATGTSASVNVSASDLLVRSSTNGAELISNLSLTINASVTGSGSAVAGNTWYAVWVDTDGTTPSGYLDTSGTSPTPPTGHTNYARARVGWVLTDGLGTKYPLAFVQEGREVQLSAPRQMLYGTTSGPQAVGVNSFIPTTAQAISLTWGVTGTGSGSSIAIGPNAAAAVASSSGFAYLGSSSTTFSATNNTCMLLESRNIYVNSNNANGFVGAIGWKDNL